MSKYSLGRLPIDILKVTAENHRRLRKQAKLSQAELAIRSGVSLGSIKRFEQTGKISFEALLKLAHVLDRLADFDQLFKANEDLSDIERLFSDKTRSK